ncbi:hypothetical protein Pcinc_001526 [Petrolisthes cinctipes]|uniref:Uncharacterized protein n=1 Tax=Petrolisthes cinctipes TaxID=88211 RepID=A0AAE1L5X4_PETCI|nr:hypothetical protein Pcinc_001526 [Petrolisthes cinctipes]
MGAAVEMNQRSRVLLDILQEKEKCYLIFLSDGVTLNINLKEIAELRSTLSIGVFQVDDFGHDANLTQSKLSKLVAHARQVG